MREKLSTYRKINAHGHLLPYPSDIPVFMKEKEYFWIDDQREFMHQKGWRRPITDENFFLEKKLEWMEREGIDHEVLITLSQLYCNGLPREETKDITRFQNDFHAKIQYDHPEKFTGGFVVQPRYLDMALDEIERCVEELNLKVLCLPTHYQDQTGAWRSTANEENEEIYALADTKNLAIELHPYDAPKMIDLGDRFWRFHLIWMCAQTADTYHMFSSLGWASKYPGVRTCFAHGNQFGQMGHGRRKQGFHGRPDLFDGAADPDESIGLSNVYFDTLVHDVFSFRLMVERSGADQLLFGIDDPYPLGEMDVGHDCYPGHVIEEAKERGFIDEDQRVKIYKDNTINWLLGKND